MLCKGGFGSLELPTPVLVEQQQSIPVHFSCLREESSNPLVFNVCAFIVLFLDFTFLPNLILAYFQPARTSFSVACTGFSLHSCAAVDLCLEQGGKILFFTAVIFVSLWFHSWQRQKCGVRGVFTPRTDAMLMTMYGKEGNVAHS